MLNLQKSHNGGGSFLHKPRAKNFTMGEVLFCTNPEAIKK